MFEIIFKLFQSNRSNPVLPVEPELPSKPESIVPAPVRKSEMIQLNPIIDKNATNDLGFGIRITFSGPQPLPVPKEMLEAAYEEFKFIAESEPSPLTADNIWFVRDGPVDSNGLPVWMSPLLPSIDFGDADIRRQFGCEPNGLAAAAIAVRKRIRAKRKAKETYHEELDFLYRLAVLDDLVSKCVLPGLQDYIAMRSLPRSDLAQITVDYNTIGYDSLSLLGVTDKKWLNEERGAPKTHASVADLYPAIIKNALSRHFWSELNRSNSSAIKLGREPVTIEHWLKHHLEFHLGYQLEYMQRMERQAREEAETAARASQIESDPDEVLKVLAGEFVVADLETTGFSPQNDAIIELGAIKVKNSFADCERFSTLVSSNVSLPDQIKRLTGITDQDLKTNGVSLSKAIADFGSFVGDLPVLFHNAGFDRKFLESAFNKLGQAYNLRVYDTLELFRRTWPEQPKHKLQHLCEQFSIYSSVSHRALADSEALLDLIKLAIGQEHRADKRTSAD